MQKWNDMRRRRFLPSLKTLTAFDAVLRHRSVTHAAEELNLTQSSVSRLVFSLEEQLGKELFTRERRRLIPNAVALAYHKDVARVLDILERASMAVVANPHGGTLSLAVLPTFATRWLGPRLGEFLAAHPGISVNLSTRIGRVDFAGEAFDAAIYFGSPEGAGTRCLKLLDERMTACVSPEFAARHPLVRAEDLGRLPLLKLESRPHAWADWFMAQGAAPQEGEGMLMDQFSMMIQAAISGLGVALLPDYLARAEIESGRLEAVLKPAVPVRGAYWLTWPESRNETPPLTAFRAWLSSL
ncbi:LysR family transcriptional regulator [Thioclava kandeliae]